MVQEISVIDLLIRKTEMLMLDWTHCYNSSAVVVVVVS